MIWAAAALIGAPGALVFGRLADRTTNPRRIVRGSLVGVGVPLGLVPLISSIPILIVLDALLWLVFAAAGPVLVLLVVAGVAENEWS